MDSLALAAIAVVVGTALCALVSAFVAFRPPASRAGHVAAAPFALGALASGARLALLPIGVPMRVVGALMACCGLAALVSCSAGRRPGSTGSSPS